jgi:membrane protease YdiL (CAAX protease family)
VIYFSAHLAVVGAPVPPDSLILVNTQLFAAIIGYLVLTMYMEQRVWPWEFAPRRWLGLLKGMLLGIALIAACIGLLALLGVYRIDAFNGAYNPWLAIYITGIVAAISEEILFRGVIFRFLEEGVGSWGAVIGSSLIFGLAHIANPDGTLWGGLAIAIQSLVFAGIYLLTRSLWWCIGLHFAWNITQGAVFGSIVSGSGARDSWFQASWSGSDLLTGGSFGLEGSLVTILVIGAFGALLLVLAARQAALVQPIWIRKGQLT